MCVCVCVCVNIYIYIYMYIYIYIYIQIYTDIYNIYTSGQPDLKIQLTSGSSRTRSTRQRSS